MIACMASGAALSGVFPLVMATIPSEVVGPAKTATALSLTMGISEIVGGVFAPSIAGKRRRRARTGRHVVDTHRHCGGDHPAGSCSCVKRRPPSWGAGHRRREVRQLAVDRADLPAWSAHLRVAEQDHSPAGRLHRPCGPQAGQLRVADRAGDHSLGGVCHGRWFVHRSHRRAHRADHCGDHRHAGQHRLSAGRFRAGIPGDKAVRRIDHGVRLLGGTCADHGHHLGAAPWPRHGAVVHLHASGNIAGAVAVWQLSPARKTGVVAMPSTQHLFLMLAAASFMLPRPVAAAVHERGPACSTLIARSGRCDCR